jgi:hypothetical protein
MVDRGRTIVNATWAAGKPQRRLFLNHYFGGFDYHSNGVTGFELHLFGASPGDHAFDFVIANLNGYMGHDLAESYIADLAAELISCGQCHAITIHPVERRTPPATVAPLTGSFLLLFQPPVALRDSLLGLLAAACRFFGLRAPVLPAPDILLKLQASPSDVSVCQQHPAVEIVEVASHLHGGQSRSRSREETAHQRLSFLDHFPSGVALPLAEEQLGLAAQPGRFFHGRAVPGFCCRIDPDGLHGRRRSGTTREQCEEKPSHICKARHSDKEP